MRTLTALVASLAVVMHAAAAIAQTPPAATTATVAGSVEKGRVTFAKVGCAQCHGREAQGSPTTGPRLGPGGLPYTAFSRYVRAPRLQMPPYSDRSLSDPDLADIFAFVQSRPKPATPQLLRP